MKRINFKVTKVKVKDSVVSGTYRTGSQISYNVTGDKDKLAHPEFIDAIKAFKSEMAEMLDVNPGKIDPNQVIISEKDDYIEIKIGGKFFGLDNGVSSIVSSSYDIEEFDDLEEKIENVESEFYNFIFGNKQAQQSMFDENEEDQEDQEEE